MVPSQIRSGFINIKFNSASAQPPPPISTVVFV